MKDLVISREEHLDKPEGEIVVSQDQYHNHQITTIGMEHHDLHDQKVPDNWQYVVGQVLDQNLKGTVFLEYAVPDLQRHLLMEPGMNILGRIWLNETNVLNFFGEVARLAGERGMRIAVADPASNSLYALQEFSDLKTWNDKHRRSGQQFVQMNGHNTAITEAEENTPNAIDARRLLTTRGMLEHILREDENVVYIGPPAHILRIDNYIERQIGWERGNPVTTVNEFKTSGDTQETKKLKRYLNNPLFNKNVRYYLPKTLPGYYKIDGLVKQGKISEARALAKQMETECPSIRGVMIRHILDVCAKSNTEHHIRNIAMKIVGRITSTTDSWKFQRKIKIH